MYARALIIASAAVGIAAGIAAGVGGFTFVYAKGASYMFDDPAACVNCHVMRAQFDAWAKSSHHAVATCNDCHTPHNLAGKYTVKALNGYHHSLAFTTGEFAEPIRIKPGNLNVTEQSCRHCHQAVVEQIDHRPRAGVELSCVRCHANVGHAD
ncbi:cytochrome c nitrite reductase small subunit [bacterium]|nr:cytochrome c nitrite reductase small subunit [bacterium]